MVEEELLEASMKAFVDGLVAVESGAHAFQTRRAERRTVEAIDDRLGDDRVHGAPFGARRHMAQIYKRTGGRVVSVKGWNFGRLACW